MIMLSLFRSILFGFVLLGTGLAAQGVDLQRLLQNDPDLQKQIDALSLGNSQRNDTFGVPTSQPPQVLNSNDLRGNPALIFQSEVQSSQGKSVLSQYFSILTGMVLAIVFKTQTGAAFIAFWGFVALFAVAYRWALRRGGQAANRVSRKFEQS